MRRIRPGTVTVAMLAILFGLVAAYTARRYMEPPPAAPERTVPVVMAKINLPTYARLRESDLELVRMPPELVPAGAISTIQRALYRVVKDTTMSGQPLLEAALYPVGQMPTLADQVPPGFRAVTIAVDRNNALAGVLMPQATIDIAVTVKGDHPDLHGVTTMTLLRNVKVLATSQHLYKAEEKINQSLRSVTVAVSPEDANKLILAQKYGSLSVTLCNPGEVIAAVAHPEPVTPQDTDAVNPMSLLGLKAVEPVKPVLLTKAQILRGTSMTEVTFKEGQIIDEKSSPTNVVTVPEPAPVAAPSVVPTGYGREVKPNEKPVQPPLGTAAQR